MQSKGISPRNSYEYHKFLASHLFLMMTVAYPFSSNNTPKCLQTINMCLPCFSSSPNMSTSHMSALCSNLLSVLLHAFELTPICLSFPTHQQSTILSSSDEGFKSLLYAFFIECSRCVKFFAFIGNRLF